MLWVAALQRLGFVTNAVAIRAETRVIRKFEILITLVVHRHSM